ncbi:MAG: type I-C CRISPR-associated protein Cas8c/Csd1 [Lachnospiraceae bacterium]|nr:type I-C CRISPR-associated protein Cas8c/Csd1 [Lachnospiraceae bacterium]
MSWLNDLYLTYEACKGEAGIVKANQPLLLPMAHLTQNAQLEVVLDGEGNFSRAYRVQKEDAVTVIPVTEDSGSRSGKAVFPHPLADKLEYIAGDYGKFVKVSEEKFEKYIAQLEKWALSPYSLPQIKSVYQYLRKGRIMQDLLEAEFFAFENGKVTAEKQQGVEAENWFVRFAVEIPGREESRLYCDTEVFESYIQFYLAQQEKRELCYASGEKVPCSEKHPAKIRHTGDKAKLISSNDASGVLTYKGRFSESSQVASVSYEVSQKAHSALRWLIAKQACLRVGEQVFVVWSVENPDIKNPFEELFGEAEEKEASTNEAYAALVRKAIWGTERELKESDSVMVMGVEAATTGRLSIPFYQKYGALQFIQNITKWKTEACWINKPAKEKNAVWWSPSLIDIVKLVAGDKNDKLNKSMRERLLPCIVEGRKLPYDVVLSAVRQAVNPMHYDNDWEWNKAVMIACALLRKWQIERENREEGYSMELNEESKDRSYIFGRLLATAEMLERSALRGGGKEIRNTAAEKYFVRFQRYPVETWNTIRNQLQPYILKLNAEGKRFYVEQLDKIAAELDFAEKSKLEPTFLQGYSCQMMAYWGYFKKDGADKEENAE